MVLNFIWIGFFLIAFVIALVQLIFFQNYEVFPEIMTGIFSSAKTGFEISLGLTGVLSLWMGFLKVGEKGGAIKGLSRIISPLLQKLFPELGKNHPAYASITMNIAANMLGLDNAATPIGLKAMQEMQESNKNKETASNAMIMFLVINTSGLTIIPVSIMVFRAQLGAVVPTDIFVPILLATFFSTLAGVISVAIYQRINLFNKVVLGYLGGLLALVLFIIWGVARLSPEQVTVVSQTAANLILFFIILLFIILAIRKKINVYEAFIEGAKDGFKVAISIIPYLVAILVAIAAFRASGAMDMLTDAIRLVFEWMGFDTRFVESLPTAMMKPLSGSGARGMMVDALSTYGADSFVGRVASCVQGATDTTFYIIAVYFGSVGIKRTRYAVQCGLIADFVGIVAAIFMAYLFFG